MGAQELTRLTRVAVLDDEARAAYAAVVRDFDTSGGLQSVDDLLAGADLFEIVHGGRVVLRYALRVDDLPRGREGVIVAAVGDMPGVSLCNAFLPVIEEQLAGVAAVRAETTRKGMAAKLMHHGYEMHFCLRKKLND